MLERCAALFSRLERLLFVAIYAHGETLNAVKRRFITEHRITSRQFSAIHKQLSAKVDSWREVRKLNMATVEKQIAKTETAVKKARSAHIRHQKKRRLQRLLDRKNGIESALSAPVPSICFGSRALNRKQFHLRKNGYADHAAWRKEWQATRAASFFVLGSADETSGNQTCQYHDGALHLRLPDALGGETITIPVKFRYRENDLLAALTPSMQKVTRGPRKGSDTLRPSAVSYRFICRDGRWHVQAMFDVAAAPVTTSRTNGCGGIDVNPWGLALTRIDGAGNPVDSLDIPWAVEGRQQDQVSAAIGDGVRIAVLYAKKHAVPVAVERLDFADKKHEDRGARMNRMLTAFAYSAFAQMIRGRCAREGVELIEVNPAFTSVIGQAKFAAGYGLSVHRSAACAIGRRALHFGEALRSRHTGSALALPARNRTRHVWSDWGRWVKARRSQRKASSKPKGSCGSEPPGDRGNSLDPSPPNDRRTAVGGSAGERMLRTNAALILSGAIPEANCRPCCSGGVVRPKSQAA